MSISSFFKCFHLYSSWIADFYFIHRNFHSATNSGELKADDNFSFFLFCIFKLHSLYPACIALDFFPFFIPMGFLKSFYWMNISRKCYNDLHNTYIDTLTFDLDFYDLRIVGYWILWNGLEAMGWLCCEQHFTVYSRF